MLRCSFFIFTWLVFSELSGSLVWCLTLIWGNSQSLLCKTFLLFLFLFLLLLVFPFHICHTVCSCPWVFCSFFLSFFPLHFSVLKDLIDTSSSTEIPSSAVSRLLIRPSRVFFISSFLLQCLLSLAFHFGSF